MSRAVLLRTLAPALVFLLIGLPVVAGPALAAASDGGTLTFVPATGRDDVPLSVVSSGLCTDPKATNLQLRVSGAGFPADTNVTPNLLAAIYPIDPATGGYDVPLQDTLRDFAAQQSPPAQLSGRYVFTLVCRSAWGTGTFDTYEGALVFGSPTSFSAVGAATPTAAAPVTPVAGSVVPRTSPPHTRVPHATPRPATTALPVSTPVKTPVTGAGTPTHSAPPSVRATHAAAQAAPRRRAATSAATHPAASAPTRTVPSLPADSLAPSRVSATPADAASPPPVVSPGGGDVVRATAGSVRHGPAAVLVVGLAMVSLFAAASLGLVARRRVFPRTRGDQQ